MRFRGVFAGLLADEKALAETADAKGASGQKPCPWCSNVVGRCRPDEVRAEGLVHYVCSDFGRLIPWTPEALCAEWDDLGTAARLRLPMSQKACKRREQAA